MSNTQYALMKRSKIPTREMLQSSIDALGFDLKLDQSLDLVKDSGFSPCVLCGISDVGFELSSGPIQEIFGEDDEMPEFIGENDAYIGMSWRGSMKDCASVMIVSCALLKDFGAVISYEGEPPEPLDSMLENTQRIVTEALNEKPGKKRK